MQDRRIRKTQQAIINATVKLLDREQLNRITVKEICAEADISRSTFYLHYLDAPDVIEQVHNDIAASVSNFLDMFDYTSILCNPRPFLEKVIAYIKDNVDLYIKLLQNSFRSNFRRRLKSMLEKKIVEENIYRFKDKQAFEFSVSFLMSGLVETICDNMIEIKEGNNKTLMEVLIMHISSGFNLIK